MKKIGITILGKRIAPVFDVSGRLLILEIENKNVINRSIETIDAHNNYLKIDTIKKLGIETLICGAVSKRFLYKIEENGIYLISFICGNIEDVISRFLSGKPLNPDFAMPGSNFEVQ
jgi:predicted Fe-Mo cluster-binding NifX family protein